MPRLHRKLAKSWWKLHTKRYPGGMENPATRMWQFRLGYGRHRLPLWHSKSVKNESFLAQLGYEV